MAPAHEGASFTHTWHHSQAAARPWPGSPCCRGWIAVQVNMEFIQEFKTLK